VMAPIEHVEIAPPVKGRRDIGLAGIADHHGQRTELLIVGRIEQLRRGLPPITR
jgi:hypothetical protein